MTLHDDSVLIAKIEKNNTEEVRVQLRKWKDRWNIDVRVYYPEKNGTMAPAKAGIALSVDKLPELEEAITAAAERAREQGMVK